MDKLQLLQIYVRAACNLRCAFCGYWGNDNRPEEGEQMPFRRILNAMKPLEGQFEGLPRVTLTGNGEPLMAKDAEGMTALDFLEAVGTRFGRRMIATNGTLLERHVEQIGRAVDTLFVSVHGLKDTHNHTVGSPSAYDALLRSLRVTHERYPNLKLTTNSVVNVENYGQLEEMIAEYTSWPLEAASFTHLFFTKGSAFDKTCADVDVKEIARVMAKYHDKRINGTRVAFHPFVKPEDLEKEYDTSKDFCYDPKFCVSLRGRMGLWYDGRVFTCAQGSSYANINTDDADLLKIWKGERKTFANHIEDIVEDTGRLPNGCVRCCRNTMI